MLLLEIFSKPSCSFRTWMVSILPLQCQIKGLLNGKVLLRYGRKKVPSDLVTFSLSPLLVFEFALLVCFAFLFWVSLVLCFILFKHVFVCLFFNFTLFCFSYKFFFEKSEKYKNSVSICLLYTLFSLNNHFIFFFLLFQHPPWSILLSLFSFLNIILSLSLSLSVNFLSFSSFSHLSSLVKFSSFAPFFTGKLH